MQPIQQIHHISAIVGDPQTNVAFYRDVGVAPRQTNRQF